jgi:hypothetical protein
METDMDTETNMDKGMDINTLLNMDMDLTKYQYGAVV